MQKIIAEENISHIIPTCEEVFYFSRYKKQFNCKVWTTDFSLMAKLHNKFSFTEIANGYLSIPATVRLTDFFDWGNSERYVFKPCFSRFGSEVIRNKKVASADFSAEEKKSWIAQRFIKGNEICTYSVWDEGNLKAFSFYKPAYRVGEGAGIYFEPVHHRKTFESIQAFGKLLNYTGQLSFDVIIDETDEPWFIECNPRATSGGHLINVRLAEAFMKNENLITQDGKEYCIAYAMFLKHFSEYFSSRVRKSKDVVFRNNDMKPFFLQLLSLFEIQKIKRKNKISFLGAATFDIEWNGEPDPLS